MFKRKKHASAIERAAAELRRKVHAKDVRDEAEETAEAVARRKLLLDLDALGRDLTKAAHAFAEVMGDVEGVPPSA